MDTVFTSTALSASFPAQPARLYSGPRLRDYQERHLAALEHSYCTGHRAPLLTLPTGAGKTVIFAEATRLAVLAGTSILVVTHRRELVHQASAKLTDAGVTHGIIAAGTRLTPALVQVASLQTAIRRDVGRFDLIILDEAHHAVAASWQALIAAQPDAWLLGVTATPARLDGKGLGVESGGIFDDLVIGASIAELTSVGWLPPARVYTAQTRLNLRGVTTVAGDYHRGQLDRAVRQADLAGDAVGEYRRRANHQPTLAFCASIEHAEATAAAFRQAGYRAAAVHGALPDAERDQLIAGLGNGAIEILTSCEIISEGLDVPSVGCVILLRPTQSLTVHLQQIGRGLRPAPGKTHLTVLDLAGNCLVHGLPDEVHHWTLTGVPKRQSGQAPGWECRCCACLNPLGAALCLDCGTPRPAHERNPLVDSTAELVELERQRDRDRLCRLPYRRFMAAPRTLEEFEIYRHAHGYKPGWVYCARQQQAQMFSVTR